MRLCGLLCTLLFVALASLFATQTTIFDKMKGSPLNKTDFAIGATCMLVGTCAFFVVVNCLWPDEDDEDDEDDDDEKQLADGLHLARAEHQGAVI